MDEDLQKNGNVHKKRQSSSPKFVNNEPEEELKEDIPPASFFTLYRFATKSDKCLLTIGVIAALISGAIQPLNNLLFGHLTQTVIDYAQKCYIPSAPTCTSQAGDDLLAGISQYAIWNSVIGLGILITAYISAETFNYTSIKQVFKVRTQYLQKLLNKDVPWFDVNNSGDFASRMADDLSKYEDGIGEKIPLFITLQAMFISALTIALVKGWELALICLISLPVSLIAIGTISFLTTKFSQKELDAYGAAGSIAEEVLTSIRTVIAFGGEKLEKQRFDKSLIFAKNNNIKRHFFEGTGYGILWFCIYSSFGFSFWYGVKLILDGNPTYTPGNMITVFLSVMAGSQAFGVASPFIEALSKAKAAGGKVFHIIDNPPEINLSKGNGQKLSSIKGHVNMEFKNVHFHYPARKEVPILQGFSLKINAGETVALVGSSGCGKSTALQLIQRFYDPLEGQVLVEGKDIKDLDLSWYRQNIGVVSQEPILFDTTIAENIRYGNRDALKEDIIQAAKMANADKFIKGLPNGYETLVGERGAQLSGGQKQRIAIARALVRNPAILLLDEATSALDNNSEAKVQAALDKASKNRTTLIVAHRLSTIRGASKIVVISKGKVVEQGTHDELMKLGNEYFTLVTTQVQGNAEFEDKEEKSDRKDKFELLDQDDETDVSPVQMNLSKVDHITLLEVKIQKIVVKLSDLPLNVMRHSERILNMLAPFIEKLQKFYSEVQDESLEVDNYIKKATLWSITKLNQPEWFYIVVGSLGAAAMGAAMPIFAVLFGDILNVLQNTDTDYVKRETNKYALFFVLTGVLAMISTFLQMSMFGIAGEKLTLRIRSKMFESLLKQEMAYFDRKTNGVGALCSQLSNEAAQVQGATGQRIGAIMNSMACFILCVGLSLYYQWKLGLVALAFFPVILTAVFLQRRQVSQENDDYKVSLQKSTKIAVEAVSNFRTVVSLGCEETFYNLYVNELVPHIKRSLRISHGRAIVLGLSRSVMLWAYSACMYYGGTLIKNEGLEYGVVFKVAQSLIMGTMSIANSLAFTPNLEKGLVAAKTVMNLINRIPKVQNQINADVKTGVLGNVKYDKVHFSYPTRDQIPVLKGLDLSVMQGKTIALVGSSGCGKSTIIQLIERFYDPSAGAVSLDEHNIKSITLGSLRSYLGIVSQEPNLFSRTIKENIAYGDNAREVTEQEVIEAAKKANIHNFISQLPLGYNTKLGEKGTQLSGGQKQRIAIARALVRNPKVLLLDEATSALDAESEKVVQEALDNAKQGRTCITIAHRLTTIQDADLICVVNEGVIAEQGTHHELIRKRGLYFQLHTLQHS